MMIDILLATYNGQKFLNEQIDSIVNQSYKRWTLLIRDDLSTDNTIGIINSYINKYPEKIRLFTGSTRLGPCRNFNYLLQRSHADYVMFCDQDDIWLPEKIQLSIEKIKQLEKEHVNIPILVHTDLMIIDSNRKIISDSFWKTIRLNPEKRTIIDLLGTSNTNGNTIIMNRKLKKIINTIPEKAIMHDWWSAIIAAEFGLVIPLKKQTVLYRQHDNNAVGAIGFFKRLPLAHVYLHNIYKQVIAFENKYNLRYSKFKIFYNKTLSLIINHLVPYK